MAPGQERGQDYASPDEHGSLGLLVKPNLSIPACGGSLGAWEEEMLSHGTSQADGCAFALNLPTPCPQWHSGENEGTGGGGEDPLLGT